MLMLNEILDEDFFLYILGVFLPWLGVTFIIRKNLFKSLNMSVPASRFVFPWGSHTLVAFDVIYKWTLHPVATVESCFPSAISLLCLLTFGFLEQPWGLSLITKVPFTWAARRVASPGKQHLQEALTKAEQTRLPSPCGNLASMSCWRSRFIQRSSPHHCHPLPPHTPQCRYFHYLSLPGKSSDRLLHTNIYPPKHFICNREMAHLA